jgi:hypothetical protein
VFLFNLVEGLVEQIARIFEILKVGFKVKALIDEPLLLMAIFWTILHQIKIKIHDVLIGDL